MKLAYFDPTSGLILQWMDTGLLNYNLPDASMLHECTDAEWERQFFETPQAVKDGVIVDYTPPIPPRAELVAKAWRNIKTERDRRKAGGVKVGAKWFHSDDGSRIQQMSLVMMGANLPAGLQWKTMDGSFIAMTPALAQQIFAGQAASDQAIFAAAEQHRVAMEASADPASYDYSTGWPKIFGE